jgi:hypothetical protein
VSGDLGFSYIYVTDTDEVERAHAGPFRATFDPPLQGGRNRKNRDFAGTQRAVVSFFWAVITVGILEGTVPSPRRRILFSRPGRYGDAQVKI